MSRLTTLLRRLRRPTETRETAVQIAKAVVAGTASWWVAGPELGLTAAAFAPLAALMVVGLTVQHSMLESARHIVAVLIGAVLAVVIGLGTEVQVWAVALVLVVGLLVARWRWLDDQRFQVPVIALFAFAVAAPGGSVLSYAGGLLASVLLGATAGLVVNVVIAPPLYQQSADDAVRALSVGVRDQLRTLADELRENWPSDGTGRRLVSTVAPLKDQISRTRDALRYAEESLRFNPRSAGRPQVVAAHRSSGITLSRAAEQVIAIAQTLLDAADEDRSEPPPGPAFLRSYANLLKHLADTIELSAAPDSHHGALQQRIDEGRAHHRRLAEDLGKQPLREADSWPVYGALLADVQRLLDELSQQVRPTIPAQAADPGVSR